MTRPGKPRPSHFLLGLWLCATLSGCKAEPRAETPSAGQPGAAQATATRSGAERAGTATAVSAARPAASTEAPPKKLYLPETLRSVDTTVLVASGAPSSQPAPQPAPGEKLRYVVAAVGDSLTDARSHGGGYLKYLQQHCPESVFDNYGVGGEMVNQMRRRFTRDVLDKKKYTDVIVYGGVNDLYSDQTAGRSNEKIESDLSWMYEQARLAGLRVTAITVSPWGGFTRYWNERRGQNTLLLNRWIAVQVAARKVDHVLDSYPLLSCGTPTELCPEYQKPFKDGLHFGPTGHEILGAALFERVFSACR